MHAEMGEPAGAFRYDFRHHVYEDVVTQARELLLQMGMMQVDPIEGHRLYRIGMAGRFLGAAALVGRMWCAPAVTKRTAAHVADRKQDTVMLVLPLTVPMNVSRTGQAEETIRPGEVFIWPEDQTATFAYGAFCRAINIVLPGASANPFRPYFMKRVAFDAAPGLYLLKRYADLIVAGKDFPSGADGLAGRHLADLALLALDRDRDARWRAAQDGGRMALLASIKADIRSNPGNPALSLEWLAGRHRLRPRAIQNLFYGAGEGFADFVRAARLQHAHAMLSDPAHLHRNIAEIAFASGFNDVSWFNASFRRHFGVTPSDVRQAVEKTQKM